MIRLLTAGESHGESLTAILDGMPAGLAISKDFINQELARRQMGYGAGDRMKIEKDVVKILSGVLAGQTTGAPIALMVQNIEHGKWKGKAVQPMTVPRPGHADLTGAVKYGYRDLRLALERASARETVMRVAAGAICKCFLTKFGITVGGYVQAIGDVSADLNNIPYQERINLAEQSDVRCPEKKTAIKIKERIDQVIRDEDTLGGVLEIIVLGVPAGLGTYAQWDRRLDAQLGAAVLSVPAVKGLEIGEAFANTRLTGTQAHDAIRLDGKNLVRLTNKSGGIEGGVSNGQPIVIRAAMKSVATTLTPQMSVDLATGEETLTKYERSDYCPVPRAVPVLESMVAFVLVDVLIEKLGGDSLDEMIPRFETLRRLNLCDIQVDRSTHIWWE